ncbi:hypothetical protein GW17_00026878 [Ensete ventricosum]|nr:hypothetical protein GW17_00026878 [Ensete ventricosum]
MGAATFPSGGFLARRTPVLGLPVYALLFVFAAALLVALLLFLLRRSRARLKRRSPVLIPTSTKQIAEIPTAAPSKHDKGIKEMKNAVVAKAVKPSEASCSSSSSSTEKEKAEKKENIGWGRWYTLAELEAATAGFSPGNVIGEGGYGIVYRGVFPDFSVAAVKNLLDNKGQAEKEFKVEVEAIGKVRHKNLVGLIGYCAEGVKRLTNFPSPGICYGVLLMEIISGRSPVDYSRPVGEWLNCSQVNMVEWFKRTVQSKREEEVVDPLIEVKPSPRALKRVLLVCLRCIDMDAQKRPKMGQIVHMLEGDEFPFRMVSFTSQSLLLNI